MTIGVTIVTGLPRLYQQCTNHQKQSKDSQNSKNEELKLRGWVKGFFTSTVFYGVRAGEQKVCKWGPKIWKI